MFVSFEKFKSARTGNILFQYLLCKVISLLLGHQYIPIEEMENQDKKTSMIIMEGSIEAFFKNEITNKEFKKVFQTQHIILEGFFQKSEIFIPYRNTILEIISHSNDYWIGCDGHKQYIKDFVKGSHYYPLGEQDVVVSLRLDDFIQLPCPTSDIIHPSYYLDILESLCFDKLYIVSDTLQHDWEKKYIEFFSKWNPIFIQGDLLHDCAVMRDAPILIHSNSTLCWFMSFLSNHKKKRYIPRTHFYKGQSLLQIEENDILQDVSPLPHQDVYTLNYQQFLKKTIYPLSYCIPDECIVKESKVAAMKTTEFASLIPGQNSTYTFGAHQEEEYNKMYQTALFAITQKKGGWDCLRHYEILANGCIPLFQDLENCPAHILTTLPKKLIMEASQILLPWNYNNKPIYDFYLRSIMKHVRENCSTSATVNYFLSKIQVKPQNVLLIMGNCGVNYTRELFWIGMKRYIQSLGGVAVEYPKIDFLYKNYKGEKKNLYGNGFTYSKRLDDDYSFTEDELVDKINNKFFDLIIYGKVGPDELEEGSHPNMPLWNHVFKKYNKNQIVFLYGGDECIDLTHDNKYNQHIMYHSQFAQCFVREFQC